MKRSALLTAIALLATALPVMAGTGPAADPSEAFDVYGTVVSFTASAGSGLPTLVVDDAVLGEIELGLGALWFIQESGFSAAVGDEVEAVAFPCVICSVDYVAMWVDNLTTGASIVLRDETGKPLWVQRGGTGGGQGFCMQSATDAMRSGQGGQGENNQNGNGPQAGNGTADGTGAGDGPQAGQGPRGGQGPNATDFPGGQCEWTGPDMTAVTTVTGTVISLDVGFYTERPLVVLDVDGEEIGILLMPYSPLAAAGFLIEPGTELQVTYAPWAAFGGEELVLVAISVTDPVTGLTVQLRDPETGYPITGGGGGWGPYFGYGPGPGPETDD
jgi:hypothetical protein